MPLLRKIISRLLLVMSLLMFVSLTFGDPKMSFAAEYQYTPQDVLTIARDLITKADDPYKMSMPILASALVGDAGIYQTNFGKFFTDIKATKGKGNWMDNPGFRSWMAGRGLLASLAINKSVSEVTLSRYLQALIGHDEKAYRDLLAPEVYNDSSAFAAWGIGYAATHAAIRNDTVIFQKYQTILTTIAIPYQAQAFKTSKVKSPSNMIWTYGMAIMMATANNDRILYNQLLDDMVDNTGQEEVMGVVRMLSIDPNNSDYRAWYSSILLNAAEHFNDQKLSVPLQQLLAEDLKTTKVEDRMLAMATRINYQQKLQHQAALQPPITTNKPNAGVQ